MTPMTGAIFSPCEKYRYRLWRNFREGASRPVNFLMLNPSTADATSNDPTIERCSRRVLSWGFDGIVVTNLFAWRSTSPTVLKHLDDPIGPGNNQAIKEAAAECALVICAWGKDGDLNNRSSAILPALLRNFPDKVAFLRRCKDGQPEHPLYVPYSELPKSYLTGKALVEAPADEQGCLFGEQQRTAEAL